MYISMYSNNLLAAGLPKCSTLCFVHTNVRVRGFYFFVHACTKIGVQHPMDVWMHTWISTHTHIGVNEALLLSKLPFCFDCASFHLEVTFISNPPPLQCHIQKSLPAICINSMLTKFHWLCIKGFEGRIIILHKHLYRWRLQNDAKGMEIFC